MRFERRLGIAQLLSLLALFFFVAVTRGSTPLFNYSTMTDKRRREVEMTRDERWEQPRRENEGKANFYCRTFCRIGLSQISFHSRSTKDASAWNYFCGSRIAQSSILYGQSDSTSPSIFCKSNHRCTKVCTRFDSPSSITRRHHQSLYTSCYHTRRCAALE